jgi:hypothetical protein
MFMVSVKLTQKRMLLCALALVVVVAAGFIWVNFLSGDIGLFPEVIETSERKTEKVDTQNAAAKTNEQRLAFIESFGWEVEQEPIEVLEVIIPKEFDDVYSDYNAMQKVQGCDLEKYAGKRCKRYSYVVNNYPDQPDDVRINLIVYKNKTIGGDVTSLRQGGFIHGFKLDD